MKQSLFGRRIVALLLIAGSLLVGAAVAGALTEPPPDQIVTHVDICHRTNSNQKPYIVNSPAADGDVSGHDDHRGSDDPGPVWNPTLKAQHIVWGDIIPPFRFGPNPGDVYPGLNWTAEGQAIYHNGNCVPPGPPPEQEFGTLTIAKAVVNPTSPDVPSGGFTVHVDCDDKTRNDITIPKEGTGATPVTIDDIEAGSKCIVTEVNPPPNVSYTPTGINTTGVFVDADQTVAVTITNTFTIPAPPIVAPTVAAEAITVSPTFTG